MQDRQQTLQLSVAINLEMIQHFISSLGCTAVKAKEKNVIQIKYLHWDFHRNATVRLTAVTVPVKAEMSLNFWPRLLVLRKSLIFLGFQKETE